MSYNPIPSLSGNQSSFNGPLSSNDTITAANLVYTTADQSIGGNKTFTNNIIGNGTSNRLPNQTSTTSDSIIIRRFNDIRDQYTSTTTSRITGDDVYQLGVMEHFNDFTELIPAAAAGAINSNSNVFFSTLTGGTCSFSHAFDDNASVDIINVLPHDADRYSYRGVGVISTPTTFNSVCLFSPTLSLAQNIGQYYTATVGWRIYVAQTDSGMFMRFGNSMSMGGQFGSTTPFGQRALCYDRSISPNLFFAQPNPTPNSRTYVSSSSADTGIPLLSCTWANIYLDYYPSATYGVLSTIDLTVVYGLSGLRYTYRYTPNDGATNLSQSSWWKRNAAGILFGQQDSTGGQSSRKAFMLDWVYLKTMPLSSNIIYPANWNSTRFTK